MRSRPALACPAAPRASDHFRADIDEAALARDVSAVAHGLVGSEILRIAAEIRARAAEGAPSCNLTVGDFNPREFRIPEILERGIAEALREGQTNYPPSDGMPELRREVAGLTARRLGVAYPIESVVIAGGARPVIYGAFRTLVDPGEKVVFPVPSWNNNHYTWLVGGKPVPVAPGPEASFLPTAELLAPLVRDARLVCVNSPLNPCGTVLAREEVRRIAELVVEENRRRARTGARSLFLLWDQVYWMLTFAGAEHHFPPALVPECAPWTLVVDGISKAFAATGLRVGWALGAPHVIERLRDVVGHVGAWAPRPEQVATARMLADEEAVDSFLASIIRGVRQRLEMLHLAFEEMAREGLPVSSMTPQGAIYLSARFDLVGRSIEGRVIRTNEDIRRLLLDEARFAVVPFQAFGLPGETGWMRLSVGAVSPADVEASLPRVRALLQRVTRRG